MIARESHVSMGNAWTLGENDFDAPVTMVGQDYYVIPRFIMEFPATTSRALMVTVIMMMMGFIFVDVTQDGLGSTAICQQLVHLYIHPHMETSIFPMMLAFLLLHITHVKMDTFSPEIRRETVGRQEDGLGLTHFASRRNHAIRIPVSTENVWTREQEHLRAFVI
jgi:hypothetical protein